MADKVQFLSLDITFGPRGESVTSCGDVATPTLIAREPLGLDAEFGTPYHAPHCHWADVSVVSRRDLGAEAFEQALRRLIGEAALAGPLLGLPSIHSDAEQRLKIASEIAAARGRRWWI